MKTLALITNQEVTGTGSSTPVAVAEPAAAAADVAVTVTLVTGTLEIDLIVDGVARDTLQVTAPGVYQMAADAGAALGVAWVGAGTISAEAVITPVYCSAADVTKLAVAERAIEEVSARDRTLARIAACSDADGHLNSAFTLPLLTWGADLRKVAAQLTAAQIFTTRGSDMQGADKVVFDAADRALAWLRAVANGRVRPPDISDSTPDVEDHGLAISSRPARRWGD
jgi:phage gp36-like protein